MRDVGVAVACWLVGSALLATALGRLIRVGQSRDRHRYGVDADLADRPVTPL